MRLTKVSDMTAKNKTKSNSATTLDEVFALLEHWREHKNKYEGRSIPNNIWLKLFELENTGHYTATQLRRMFALNSQQYKTKKADLVKPVASTPNKQSMSKGNADATTADFASQEPAFCEATISPDALSKVPRLTPEETQKATKTKAVIKQLKSTQQSPGNYLDTSTIIVEYLRPDGHRLKIHTTTHNIDYVMKSFGAEAGVETPQ